MNTLVAKEIMSGNEALVIARDGLGRPQLFRQGESDLDLDEAMPFRDYPGVPFPKDATKDNAILNNLRRKTGGKVPTKDQVLDYDQSRRLFESADDHFNQEHPLMNTERWLAGYIERNNITYTDHDGRRYKMKNGQRYPVSAAPQNDNEESKEDDEIFKEDMILV